MWRKPSGATVPVAQRRLQRGHQQTVVRAGWVARDDAKGVSADTVGHQPLARFRGGEITTNIAAEINNEWNPRDSFIACALHRRIMELYKLLGQRKNGLFNFRDPVAPGSAILSDGMYPQSGED